MTEKAAPVMNIIHSIFSLILKFRSQLISQSWSFDAGKQMAVHPNFGLMQQSYNTFKYYSHFLFKGKKLHNFWDKDRRKSTEKNIMKSFWKYGAYSRKICVLAVC